MCLLWVAAVISPAHRRFGRRRFYCRRLRPSQFAVVELQKVFNKEEISLVELQM